MGMEISREGCISPKFVVVKGIAHRDRQTGCPRTEAPRLSLMTLQWHGCHLFAGRQKPMAVIVDQSMDDDGLCVAPRSVTPKGPIHGFPARDRQEIRGSSV